MESPHLASLRVVGQPGNDESLELGSVANSIIAWQIRACFLSCPNLWLKGMISKFASKPMIVKGNFPLEVATKTPSGQLSYCFGNQGLFSLRLQPMAKGDDKQVYVI